MGLIEARTRLEDIINSKLTFETEINKKDDPPHRLETDIYRFTFLRNYTGRGDYEGWMKQRHPEIEFVKGQYDSQMRFKAVKKPGLREYPKIQLKGWEAADFNRGALVVVYEHRIGRNRWQATHSIFLPADSEEVILNEYRRSLRHPFGMPDEKMTAEEVNAFSKLFYRATSFNPKDKIEQKITLL